MPSPAPPLEIAVGTVELRSLRLASPATEGAAPVPPQLSEALQSVATAGAWKLDPLATAQGTIRAKIVDAQLLFDADVTVPIRMGTIDFDDATVEHVGPDSRMGVSRLGLYVDAPNGRSYLYQFPATPVAGVEFEHRGALLGPWVSDRGKLHLQPFIVALLAQGGVAKGAGFTEQSRMLFDRTAVSGDLQLGDGKFAVAGVQAELAGRADGRNALRVHSKAVGRGLTLDIPSLFARNVVLASKGAQVQCDEIAGSITLQVLVEGRKVGYVLEVANLKLTGVRVRPLPQQDPVP